MTDSRAPVARPLREWVTLSDPVDPRRRYTFDVSFLLSTWSCTFGGDCQGIQEPAGSRADVGCCTHGAYLAEDDDHDALQRMVDEDLDPSLMAWHDLATAEGVLTTDEDGETHTRVVDGACIFANPAGADAPMGCALHHLAEQRGVSHVETKPTVCWQLPLHRTIDEQTGNDGEPVEEHRIEAFERGLWGEGGADFGWYCLDDETTFAGRRRVYRSMEDELRAMVGDVVYDELAAHLDSRARQRNVVSFLPLV